jgi:hypothetical protein
MAFVFVLRASIEQSENEFREYTAGIHDHLRDKLRANEAVLYALVQEDSGRQNFRCGLRARLDDWRRDATIKGVFAKARRPDSNQAGRLLPVSFSYLTHN